jgi:hypothetical protein
MTHVQLAVGGIDGTRRRENPTGIPGISSCPLGAVSRRVDRPALARSNEFTEVRHLGIYASARLRVDIPL